MLKTKIRFIDNSTGEILHEDVGGLKQVSHIWDAYLRDKGSYDHCGMVVGVAKYTKNEYGKHSGIDAYVEYPKERDMEKNKKDRPRLDIKSHLRVRTVALEFTMRVDNNTTIFFDTIDNTVAVFSNQSFRCLYVYPEWRMLTEWFRNRAITENLGVS